MPAGRLDPAGSPAQPGNDRVARRKRLVEAHTDPPGDRPGNFSLQPLPGEQLDNNLVGHGDAEASIELQAAEGKVDNTRSLEATMAVDQCSYAGSAALVAPPKRLVRLIGYIGRNAHAAEACLPGVFM